MGLAAIFPLSPGFWFANRSTLLRHRAEFQKMQREEAKSSALHDKCGKWQARAVALDSQRQQRQKVSACTTKHPVLLATLMAQCGRRRREKKNYDGYICRRKG
jgi:hypothetical protein